MKIQIEYMNGNEEINNYYIYNEDGYKIGAISYFVKNNWCLVKDELSAHLTDYPEMNINECLDKLKLEYCTFYKPLGVDVELYINGNLL